MADCTCTWEPVRLESGFTALRQLRDHDCPQHGNAVLFDPRANARAAAAFFKSRHPWTEPLIDSGALAGESERYGHSQRQAVG